MTGADVSPKISREVLEGLYDTYNRRELVYPDPVGFLYAHEDLRDREVVGLIASSLAYGRVAQINRSVSRVLELMPSPARFLEDTTPASWGDALAGFKHRFTTGDDVAAMLLGIRRVLGRFGSLGACFAAGLGRDDDTLLPALYAFVEELTTVSGVPGGYLLPSPARGSACKRLNLYLKWMVRRDAVDPGGWDRVPTSKLVIPLDVHMHRISLALGFTRRRQANLRAAVEVTYAFREIAPEDPTRYDFALSRLGIRPDADMGEFLRRCGVVDV